MQKLVRRMTRFFVSVDPLSALDRLEQAVTDLGLSYRANAPSIVSQTLSHTTAILFHTNSLLFKICLDYKVLLTAVKNILLRAQDYCYTHYTIFI